MAAAGWRELYASELQGVWAQWLVPALFLVWIASRGRAAGGVAPPAARFVRAYAIVFALETMLDPFAGGPLLRWLGLAGGRAQTAVMVFFVLLGDFRVFLLASVLAGGASCPSARHVAAALGWTLVVPLVAVGGEALVRAAVDAPPEQSIWIVYELAFFALALVWRTAIVPARVAAERAAVRAYLRALWGYVAAYYALWAAADLLIVAGLDAGWALRMVPNQLYYAWYVPFVYWRFFSPRYAATSSSTQAVR
ncbi:MAG TPA: hypothetical protein VNO26_07520 [Candidatus Limnocylindria bacterium]|nr:hypothetical protein [Candidatus Limnocylindria bacterium]